MSILISFSSAFAQGTSFRELSVFIDMDAVLVQKLGGTEKAAVFTQQLVDKVDALYRNELGLSVKLAGAHYWTEADPFNHTSQSTLLASFADYASSNYYPTTPYDSAQLLVGEGLGGEGGIAYPSSACGEDVFLSHGVFQPDAVDEYEFNTHLFSHELGHNLGADHDEFPSCAVKSIMCVAQIGNKFSDTSKTAIANYVNSRLSAGCFPAVIKVDPSQELKLKASVSGNKVTYKVEGAESCSSLSIAGAPTVLGLNTIFGYIEIGKLTPAAVISVMSKKAPAFFGVKKTKLHIGIYCNGQLAAAKSFIKPSAVKALKGTNSIVTFLNALKTSFKTNKVN